MSVVDALVVVDALSVIDMRTTRIRNVLSEHARLSRNAQTLPESADLYEAGMTSHASVNVMLALEGEFSIEFPDHMLNRSVFDSISAIAVAIEELEGT